MTNDIVFIFSTEERRKFENYPEIVLSTLFLIYGTNLSYPGFSYAAVAMCDALSVCLWHFAIPCISPVYKDKNSSIFVLFLTFSPCFSLSLSLSPHIHAPLSFCIQLCLCIALSLSLTGYFLSVPVSIFLCPPGFFFLSFLIALCHCLSLSLYLTVMSHFSV